MNTVLATLHRKERFDRPEEAEKLQRSIAELIAAGKIEEIPVARPEHPQLEEHWYRDITSGDVYRYCPPEYPSRGTWQKVTDF